MSTPDSKLLASSASGEAGARRLLGVALIVWITGFLGVRAWMLAHGAAPMSWDTDWYALVAQRGYSFDGNIAHQQPVAFLPAYPGVLRLTLALGLTMPTTVLLTCIACAAGGILLLFRGLSASIDARTSALACVLLIASPFSLYFLNGYSESLFLLVMGAFWWAMLRRRDDVLAALFAGIAGLVRPFGLVLAFVWAVDVALRAHRDGTPPRQIVAKLAALGPAAVMGPLLISLYYSYRFDDLFLYRNILVAWGDNVLAGVSLASIADHLFIQWRLLFELHPRQILLWPPELARVLLWTSLATLAFAMRRMPPQILAYGLGLIAFCLFTTIGGSNLGRHLATNIAFPLGVTLLICPREQTVHHRAWKNGVVVAIALGSFLMQMYYVTRYLRGSWVS